MPLIYLLKHGTTEQRDLAINAIIRPGATDLAMVQQSLEQSKAIEYTREFARREASLAKQALTELPPSDYLSAAIELADFVTNRTH